MLPSSVSVLSEEVFVVVMGGSRAAVRESARTLRSKGLAALLGALLAGTLLTGCEDGSGEGTVVRVIDGDTLVAMIKGEETTVRLLNIDTPETKHPDLPVQCLGPEATEFLTERLPAGTPIELEYDEERLDRYDRTLAGVYESGSLVNAEIAAEGLGVPVYFAPNERFLPEVEEAAATAQAEGLGLYSGAIDCTLPAQVEQVALAADALPATVDGDPAQALADATAVLEDADALVDVFDAGVLAGSTNAVLALPLAAGYVTDQRETAETLRDRVADERDRFEELKSDWDAEQERLEQERLEREKKEREERERKEREEREERERQEREDKEREERERKEREEKATKAPSPSSSSSSGGSSSGTKSSKSSGSKGSGGKGSQGSSGKSTGGKRSGGKSSSGSGSGSSSGSGGKSSSCVPYGPEIPYSDDGGYTGKRYGMPGGKTFRKCS